ncbi:MAG: Bug family tripartite tricarboxylate transporter substrate binding protein [Burkholderiales bacterium]
MERYSMVKYSAAFAMLLFAASVAHSQAFPSKPLRIVVPYEPGGAVDLAARDVAPKASEDLGQPIVIENRGGAGSQIGALQVARSAPDGYTFMFTVSATHALSKFASKNLPFDPVKDFTPIIGPVDTVLSIAASTALPPNNMSELIDYAKANPGKLSYGTTAVGGSTHLAMEEVARLTGASWVHIPFKGGGPITVNLVGNQLPLGALPLAPLMSQVKAGKIKVIAVFGAKRFSDLPNVGTVNEAVPQYEHLEGGIWVLGPAGMPRPIVQRLNAAITKGVLDPSARAKLEARGQIVSVSSAEVFATQFVKATELAGVMFKRAGLQPE